MYREVLEEIYDELESAEKKLARAHRLADDCDMVEHDVVDRIRKAWDIVRLLRIDISDELDELGGDV